METRQSHTTEHGVTKIIAQRHREGQYCGINNTNQSTYEVRGTAGVTEPGKGAWSPEVDFNGRQ